MSNFNLIDYMNSNAEAILTNNDKTMCSFDIKDVPILLLFKCDTEKSDFDLSKVSVSDRTFSVCYLAVSLNPRHNLPHVPVAVFKQDSSLVLYSAYKRFFDEIPSAIEQLIVANYYEKLLEIDTNVLVKYIKQYLYSNQVYETLLLTGKITYKHIPETKQFDAVNSMLQFDHQYIILTNKIKFDDVPVLIRLIVFTDEFIIKLISKQTHSITDFPYTYITNNIIKHLIAKGEILSNDIPQHLLE